MLQTRRMVCIKSCPVRALKGGSRKLYLPVSQKERLDSFQREFLVSLPAGAACSQLLQVNHDQWLPVKSGINGDLRYAQ
jgi:hypothetical protein